MVTVALIEAAAIIALVNGLAVHFTKRPPPPNPEGRQIDMPLPPPTPLPPRLPKDNPPPKEVLELPPQSPLGTSNTGHVLPDDGALVPTGGTTVIALPPIPSPPPLSFASRAPRPLGRPASWVTPNDYPPRDLREGNQGITSFSLTVGIDGRVQSCNITRSSGFAGLDEATCRKLVQRAEFKPATDGSGQAVTGEYSNNIRWVIPE